MLYPQSLGSVLPDSTEVANQHAEVEQDDLVIAVNVAVGQRHIYPRDLCARHLHVLHHSPQPMSGFEARS